MKRILSALLAGAFLLAANVQPATAYVHGGAFFSSSAIDTDSDGMFDLLICFGSDGDEINVNRQEYLEFFRQEWGMPKYGDNSAPGHSYGDGFASSDYCQSGDSANIWIIWKNHWNNCDETIGNPIIQARPYTNVAKMEIWVNHKCRADGMFDYTGRGTFGKFTMKSLLLHEIGHLLGMSHSTVNNALMHDGGPDHCNILNGLTAGIAYDDAQGFRTRYPGIYNKYVDTIPVSATCWV